MALKKAKSVVAAKPNSATIVCPLSVVALPQFDVSMSPDGITYLVPFYVQQDWQSGLRMLTETDAQVITSGIARFTVHGKDEGCSAFDVVYNNGSIEMLSHTKLVDISADLMNYIEIMVEDEIVKSIVSQLETMRDELSELCAVNDIDLFQND